MQEVRISWNGNAESWRVLIAVIIHLLRHFPSVNLDIVDVLLDIIWRLALNTGVSSFDAFVDVKGENAAFKV